MRRCLAAIFTLDSSVEPGKIKAGGQAGMGLLELAQQALVCRDQRGVLLLGQGDVEAAVGGVIEQAAPVAGPGRDSTWLRSSRLAALSMGFWAFGGTPSGECHDSAIIE